MTLNIENLKGERVLIIGGLGFIGSNLANRLVKLGARVTIYDNLDPHSGGNLFNISLIKKSIKLVFYDLLNFDLLANFICNHELIFNCAASTSHPFSMKEPLVDLDVNSRGVINILEAIRRYNKMAKFVHVGTSTQLGKLHYQPADELHPEFPMDIYSANKMVSEKYVLLYAKAYNLNATVIRLSNVFGPRASIHSPEFTFNNYFIGLALRNEPITVYKPGKQLRNVLYVEDAVNALIMASLTDKTKMETFFAVSNEHHSVGEIAEKTAEIFGGKVNYIKWPNERKAIEFGDAVISNKKIKDALKWQPEYSLENGLMLTREFYLNHLKEYLL